MTNKYVSVDYSETAGANPVVFDTLKEANADIERKWERLTESERGRSHYYTAEVTEDDLLEPGEWTSFDDYRTGLAFFDSDEIESLPVYYECGESRYTPGEGVDYMLAQFNEDGKNFIYQTPYWYEVDSIIELYAEMVNPTWDEDHECFGDDDACYDDLKERIIEQAEQNNVHPSRLNFD